MTSPPPPNAPAADSGRADSGPSDSGPSVLDRVPGLALAVGIAVVATIVGRFVPLIGAPVTAIVIGLILATLRRPSARFTPGIKTASRFVLQLSVVVLGSQLSLAQIARVGVESLPVMLGTLVICLVAAYLIGRALGIVGDLRTLIGVGTGICGASAIAAVTPVIGAVSIDVAYAISTIFLFNVTAVLLFPVVGHALGMSQHAFGLFAGTAVNDMSSVVATATTYGPAATQFAVVVKLVRTLMIIPIALVLSAWAGRRIAAAEAGADPAPARSRVNVFRLVPWFLIGFVVVAAANSIGLIPTATHVPLSAVSVFLITVALGAIGLSTDLAGFRKAGPRPLILGGALWIVVSLASLGLQFAFGLA
ncbi:YeiH family protein [Frondihabitans peucedani]|uniref:YeiH family protein n=1 Tax=Frondihabitans peucedani TaxID=598626 RepID=A0ABP8E6M5_9MICO